MAVPLYGHGHWRFGGQLSGESVLLQGPGDGGPLLPVQQYGQIEPLVLARLATLVGSDSIALTHLDLRTQHEVALFWPHRVPPPSALSEYPELGRTHPLRRARAWRRTRLFQTALPHTTDRMCLPVNVVRSSVQVVTLSRTSGVFTDRQVELLGATAGHLRAARSASPGRGRPSEREVEVLTPVARGLTDAQIAVRLGLRPPP